MANGPYLLIIFAKAETDVIKKMFLKSTQNLMRNTCGVFFNKVANTACKFIKKQIPTPQVFSCKFCEIFRNTFFTEHIRTTASEKSFIIEVCHKYTSGKDSSQVLRSQK